jgi:hypothetical protein
MPVIYFNQCANSIPTLNLDEAPDKPQAAEGDRRQASLKQPKAIGARQWRMAGKDGKPRNGEAGW